MYYFYRTVCTWHHPLTKLWVAVNLSEPKMLTISISFPIYNAAVFSVMTTLVE